MLLLCFLDALLCQLNASEVSSPLESSVFSLSSIGSISAEHNEKDANDTQDADDDVLPTHQAYSNRVARAKQSNFDKRYGQPSLNNHDNAINAWHNLYFSRQSEEGKGTPVKYDDDPLIAEESSHIPFPTRQNNSSSKHPVSEASKFFTSQQSVQIFPHPVFVKIEHDKSNESKLQRREFDLMAQESSSQGARMPNSLSYSYSKSTGKSPSYGYRLNAKDNEEEESNMEESSEERPDEAEEPPTEQYSSFKSPFEQMQNENYRKFDSNSYGNSFTPMNSNYVSFDKASREDNKAGTDEAAEVREKMRKKYPYYNSVNLADWDNDGSWLSSLFGSSTPLYSRWPARYRRPLAFNGGLDSHAVASYPATSYEMPVAAAVPNRNMGWFGWARPVTNYAARPYNLGNLFGYGQRTPYYGRYANTYMPSTAASTILPMGIANYGNQYHGYVHPSMLNHQMMSLPSYSYPLKVPYNIPRYYRYRQTTTLPSFRFPTSSANGDLAFAETQKRPNLTLTYNRLGNSMLYASSYVKPKYILPGKIVAQQKSSSKQYQDIRPYTHQTSSTTTTTTTSPLSNFISLPETFNYNNYYYEGLLNSSKDSPFAHYFQSDSKDNMEKDDTEAASASVLKSYYYNPPQSTEFRPRSYQSRSIDPTINNNWVPISSPTEAKKDEDKVDATTTIDPAIM